VAAAHRDPSGLIVVVVTKQQYLIYHAFSNTYYILKYTGFKKFKREMWSTGMPNVWK